MEILVVNGYVRENKGDAALMSVLCKELQYTFKDSAIKISSQEDPVKRPVFESWENIGSFTQYVSEPSIGKARRLIRILVTLTMPLFLLINKGGGVVKLLPKPIQKQLFYYRKSDIVISMGGGYLNGNSTLLATLGLYLMLLPLIISQRLTKCTICAPQSIGTFGTVTQKLLVVHSLKNANLILTRESTTKNLLEKLSIIHNVKTSVDSGFLLQATQAIDLRKELGIPPKSILVGITVRSWLDSHKQSKYESAIAQTIDHLVKNPKLHVVFIPQVTSALGGDDDRITGQKVYQHINNSEHVHLIEEDYDHYQIKALYNNLDALIGTRFHSVIFSLTSYIPAIAIEYEHKTSGIMRDLGLEEWVIKIEDITADILESKTDELLKTKKTYEAYLRAVIPPYIKKARRSIVLIQKAYEASTKS
jgi:colanic acid/amylovoran biosynthesis protein